MSERGLIGVSALWLIAASIILASSLLFIAQSRRAEAETESDETSLVYLIQNALLLERAAGFPSASRDYEFHDAQVHIERALNPSKECVQLLCLAKTGRTKKRIEVEWRHVSGKWRAVIWNEI